MARSTLKRALEELRRGEDEEDLRQAAEKAWRAVREAVYSVLQEVHPETFRTIRSYEIAAFERKHFRRLPVLSHAYDVAKQDLHGLCFYDNECPSKPVLFDQFEDIRALIVQAERDIETLRRQKAKKRRR